MKHSKYQQELVSTVACNNRFMEATKGIGQKYIKGGTNDCFLFDICFASQNAEEAAIGIGDNFIGILKTNTNKF